jgi:hypothetical protein
MGFVRRLLHIHIGKTGHIEEVNTFSLASTCTMIGVELKACTSRHGPHQLSHSTNVRWALSLACSVGNHDSFLNSVFNRAAAKASPTENLAL